ncbi:hypothetical protein SDJN02_10047, partial [Cucurbita argyrosperma subsp. argyrosperma]
MPFPMKIQPIDIDVRTVREQVRTDTAKPLFKSRLRRLFDRPFPSVLRSSTVEKPIVGEPAQFGRVTEFEPSSVCFRATHHTHFSQYEVEAIERKYKPSGVPRWLCECV